MARKGNGVAGHAYTLEGRVSEWLGMRECGTQGQNIKLMKDGNGQCKMAFRKPGSEKRRAKSKR